MPRGRIMLAYRVLRSGFADITRCASLRSCCACEHTHHRYESPLTPTLQTMASSHTALQQLMLKHPRLSGAIAFLCGCGVVYWQLIMPIQQAQSGASRIEFSAKITMVGFVFMLLGLTYLIFGSRFAEILQPSAEQSKVPAYVVWTVVAIISLGINLKLQDYLKDKGYTVNRPAMIVPPTE
jgi:uncharacterized protein YjeT (DUF2065 family)